MPGVTHSSPMGILIQCFFWMRKASKAGPIAAAKRSHRAATRDQPRVTVDGLTASLFKSLSPKIWAKSASYRPCQKGGGDREKGVLCINSDVRTRRYSTGLFIFS